MLPPSPPLALGSFAMAAQEGLGGDQERAPPGSREQTAECGKDGPIHWSILHACVQLMFEDPDLVPEHHDLHVIV